ncbi:helix-turn-helix domain-containing protein [Arthrobacter sp. MDT3-24]
MDRKEEIREFLISRRAKISPEQAGIPSYGELRRVPGLRREEVAQLAGVSTDYYTRLERGSIRGVSDSVLEAVASALQLDEAERAHLMDLARTANTPSSRTPRRPAQQRVRPGVLRLLDGMTGVAGMVQNGRGDVLAGNMLGRALYSEVFNSAVSFGRMSRAGCRTRDATSSSIRAQPTSTPTGTRSRPSWSRCCAWNPAGIPTTAP